MLPECTCPLCGNPTSALPLTVLPERGMVVAGGQFALLTGQESAVLQKLAQDFPRIISREALMTWLYSLRIDQEPEPKIIDVWVCKLRKKLKPLGIRIDTSRGRGYALGVTERPRIIEEKAA